MDIIEIQSRIDQCKPFIKNWEAIEELDLDFTKVDIEALLVDKHEDDNGANWKYSLITTMYSRLKDFGGRDAYSVHWGFKDLWGNLPNFIFYGPGTCGSLCLELQDYGEFARVDFSILQNKKWTSHGFEDFIFIFYEPDEISIESVEKHLFPSIPDHQQTEL